MEIPESRSTGPCAADWIYLFVSLVWVVAVSRSGSQAFGHSQMIAFPIPEWFSLVCGAPLLFSLFSRALTIDVFFFLARGGGDYGRRFFFLGVFLLFFCDVSKRCLVMWGWRLGKLEIMMYYVLWWLVWWAFQLGKGTQRGINSTPRLKHLWLRGQPHFIINSNVSF